MYDELCSPNHRTLFVIGGDKAPKIMTREMTADEALKLKATLYRVEVTHPTRNPATATIHVGHLPLIGVMVTEFLKEGCTVTVVPPPNPEAGVTAKLPDDPVEPTLSVGEPNPPTISSGAVILDLDLDCGEYDEAS